MIERETSPENRKPVNAEAFWRERIYRTLAAGHPVNRAVFDDGEELWAWITDQYAQLLRKFIKPGERVLDAGCGYGALLDSFEIVKIKVDYTGIDLSPDFIRIANYRYPKHRFFSGRLENLPFPNRHFHWAVFRSVDGMLKRNLGEQVWVSVVREVARVSRNLLVGGYSNYLDEPIPYEVYDCDDLVVRAAVDESVWLQVGNGRG